MRLEYAVICLGRVIGVERPTEMCGALLCGSGGERIRSEE